MPASHPSDRDAAAAVTLAHVVVDVDDLDTAERFYAAALDAVAEPLPTESRTIYRRLALPGQAVRLLLHRTDDPPADERPHRRVHLDVVAADVDAAAEALLAAGARLLREEDERGWRFLVLADPWGHRWCVLPGDAAPFAGVMPAAGAERGRPRSLPTP